MWHHPVGKLIITIHMLPNISRNKGNQTLKIGQLIRFNMRNIFLGKSYAKCFRENSLRLISEKWKLGISLDQLPATLCSLLVLYVHVGNCQNILKLRCWTLSFTSCKTFKKTRNRSGTSPLASFSDGFYFVRYWAICVWQFLVSQQMMS